MIVRTVTSAELLAAKCDHCGAQATCWGQYEGRPPCFACDQCCGHGCEDGRCWGVEDIEAVGGPSLADAIGGGGC